jgi:hypothetical protein
LSSEPKWKSTLKSLAREPEKLSDIFHNIHYVPTAEDRIAAIISSTSVENRLAEFLRSKLVHLNKTEDNELFGQTGPLGNHGVRIKIAYAMGLFGKQTLNDLETIRLIRNAFAHSPRALWFSTNEIKTACEKLTVIERTKDIDRIKTIDLPIDTPRKRFLAATNLIDLGMLQELSPDIFKSGDQTVDLPYVPLD